MASLLCLGLCLASTVRHAAGDYEVPQVTYLPSCVYKLKMIFLSIYCDQLCESYKEKMNLTLV
jgi:hypothetical protein